LVAGYHPSPWLGTTPRRAARRRLETKEGALERKVGAMGRRESVLGRRLEEDGYPNLFPNSNPNPNPNPNLRRVLI
jgi:hypothetical protein